MPSASRVRVLREEWNSEKNKDTVVLHVFPRTEKCPCSSMYGLKLETFLRMHDIKYIVDHEMSMHPKTSKSPWITYNGEDVADSQLCIEYLTEKLNLTLKNDLSKPDDRVFAEGIRAILEGRFYYSFIAIRCGYTKYEDVADEFPQITTIKFAQKMIVQKIMKDIFNQAKAQGIGRLPLESIVKLVVRDLETISLALGDKPFLTGDEPTEIDCVNWGFLAICKFALEEDSTIRKELMKFENLVNYVERVKEKYWPDFDELCQKALEEKKAKETPKKKGKETPAKEDDAKEGDEKADEVKDAADGKVEDGETKKEEAKAEEATATAE